MDIATIQTKFATELALIRAINPPRARKYSKALKKAIVDLHRAGMFIDQIQKALGFNGSAFKNWSA